MPKVVIALVPGWAAGGGHSLHIVCDLTIASAEHGRFKQTDADVGSFDGGYGSAYFARQVGQKFAREVFFLAQEYDAARALAAGAINAAVPHAELEATGIAWARTILGKSPTAIRMLKYAFNAVDDGMVGQQLFAGEATRLAYASDEAAEGRDAFLEKRPPDFGRLPVRVLMRPLLAVPAGDPADLTVALRAALDGSGPAILPLAPGAPRPKDLPGEVPVATAVVVATSGSSGAPKRVVLPTASLLTSAAATESALGGPGEWVLALPGHYIAGVQVIVRALAAGSEPIAVPPGPFRADAFASAIRALAADRRRYSALVPTQLHRVLEAMDDREVADAARSLDALLIGGGRLADAEAARAVEAGIRIVRTYGASETSGGCVYDGMPLMGVEVRVVDGEVQLAGPVLADGYLGDPERTARCSCPSRAIAGTAPVTRGSGTRQRLSVTGRLDDVIVSGGEKVSLAVVEAVVQSLPGMTDAVVVRAPDPEWGEVPVVLTTAGGTDLPTLRAVVAERLGRAAAPRRIVVVDPMPLLGNGKPDRVRLTALAAE